MRVLLLSDFHAPFHHPSSLDFVADLKRAYKPDRIVCTGDEVDWHNFARWQRDPDAIGPKEEIAAARSFIKQLAKLCPNLNICESNHTTRANKKAAGVGLPGDFMRSVREVLEAPATWFWSRAFMVDNVAYEHGEGFVGPRAALDAAICNMCPTAIGHIHAHAGVQYRETRGGGLWGLNAGCMVDTSAPAFNYGSTHRYKPVLGCATITDRVPQFIPLLGGAS